MRGKRTAKEEQLRLIRECRHSGMTDCEWCREQGIEIRTFYSWIHRLKQQGEIDIPAVIPSVERRKSRQADIVKIEIEGERSLIPAESTELVSELPGEFFTAQPESMNSPGYPVMEVAVGGAQLRVRNGIDLRLLAETIRMLRGTNVR